jgi:predicted lactoylglutathione lyase
MSAETATSESLSSAVDNAASSTNAAILNRLKEIENNNQMMQATIERLTAETQQKEEKIKSLSAEKRKDMEQMIETAIDSWLNSLTGVPEEVRKQFRQGISKIAEQADMQNAAWEVMLQILLDKTLDKNT